MKNKNIFISKIIKSSIIVLILFSVLSHNSGAVKIMTIPFIACGLSSVGKNVCLFMDKKKYANIFSKLFVVSFLVFLFGFLIFWSYLVIKEKNYFSLLLTIPFWLVGIYVIRKFLLGIQSKSISLHKNSKFNFQIIVSSFLVMVVLLLGIVFLFIGIKDTYKQNKITKDYITTNGYFIDYKIYNSNKNSKGNKSTTYQLIYVYEVDGMKYTVSTDYGVGYIPEKNSMREVKYNPSNPEESILVGTNSKNFLIYFGGFFMLGSIGFILGALYIKGVFDNMKINIMQLYFGFTFLIIGIGFILFQNGTTSSFLGTVKSLGIWMIIPVLFIILGSVEIIKCLHSRNFRVK